jgi:hypothetical protein
MGRELVIAGRVLHFEGTQARVSIRYRRRL